MVILAPTFPGLFADPIDRAGFHDRVLWAVFLGGGGAEHRDTGGPKKFGDLSLLGQLQDVEQGIHVQVPGPHRELLGRGAQHGGHKVNLIDLVVHHHILYGIMVGGIQKFKGTPCHQAFIAFPDITGHYPPTAVLFAQCHGQFGADLATGTDDKYWFLHERNVISYWGQIYRFLNFVPSPMRKLFGLLIALILLGGCKKSAGPATVQTNDTLQLEYQRMPEKLPLSPDSGPKVEAW